MMLLIHTFFFLLSLHGIYGKIKPDLSNYNPLKEQDYTPKIEWKHFTPEKELSASVEDFTKLGTDCTRVVVFTALGVPLEFVTISCDSPEPFLGLVHIDDVLWFYGKALVKRSDEKDQGEKKKYVTVVVNDDLLTCKKTVWIIDAAEIKSLPTETVTTTAEGGQKEDADCKDLINLNIPPMMMLSLHGNVAKFTSSSEWISYNAFEAVGARIRLYTNGFECFRLLVLCSYGRIIDAMKMACGPVQGMVMTEKAFYYGNTVLFKPQDPDMTTFTEFLSPNNGKSSKTKPSKCIKSTLVAKHEKKLQTRLTTVIETPPGPECKSLIDGEVEGTVVEQAKTTELIQTLTNGRPFVDAQILSQLEGYKVASKPSDFNLQNELGAVILFYEKSKNDKCKVVWVVARGVVLTGAVLNVYEPTKDLVIRGETLYHDNDIMMRKISEYIYSVLENNRDGKCVKTTFELKDSGGRLSSEVKNKATVDNTDQDCKHLLDGTQLKRIRQL